MCLMIQNIKYDPKATIPQVMATKGPSKDILIRPMIRKDREMPEKYSIEVEVRKRFLRSCKSLLVCLSKEFPIGREIVIFGPTYDYHFNKST